MYSVYKHENKLNHKVYIGQTNDIKRRWKNNGINYKGCPIFYNAIQKYGWDNFEHIILYDNLSQEEANYYEQLMIQFYNSTDSENGYNILTGGQGLGNYWSQEVNRQAQSERKRQYYQEHPELKNFLVEWDSKHPEQKEKHSLFMKQKYQDKKSPLCQINENRKRKIRCIETGETFDSLCDASKRYNLSAGNISKCISGQRKTCGGFHWEAMS